MCRKSRCESALHQLLCDQVIIQHVLVTRRIGAIITLTLPFGMPLELLKFGVDLCGVEIT